MITDLQDLREYAKGKHDDSGQTYGDESYVVHLDDVNFWVTEFADESISDEDLLTLERSAYGHDLIEDTGETYNDVEREFGIPEVDIIYAVTDETGKDRTERMFRTLAKIRDSRLGTLLKMADRYSNGSHSKKSGHRLYKRYVLEYPVFRFALKRGNQYVEAWTKLDELFDFKK